MKFNDARTRARLFTSANYLLVLAFAGMILLPFLYAFSVSIKPPTEFFGTPHLIPYEPTFKHWGDAFDNLREPLVNSLIIASGTAIISLFVTIPGAYAFGRVDFAGKKIGFYIIVMALLFPYVLLIIPISDLWYRLGLFNTIPGLWIAYQAFITPFAVWILRDYFEKLPLNIEEAAQVYGCTSFQAFRKVILPLSAPAVAAVGFLSFVVSWNDFLFSNMLTTGTGPRPAVVSLFITTAGGEGLHWGLTMAKTIMIGLPPTVFYLAARKYITNAFAVE